ncbi:MAG: HesB/YadR/YfhF-family protein [Solirubrobacterales bacterium]
MLAITNEAATAIDGIVSGRELPEEAGLRLSMHAAGADGEGQREIRLELVEAPRSGDEVLEEAPVFLDQEAAAVLDDKLLDADISGAQVQFAVRERD